MKACKQNSETKKDTLQRGKKGGSAKKAFKMMGIVLLCLLLLAGAAAAVFSSWVGKQVAEGLLYQNKEINTKENSYLQLEKWNYDLAAFEKAYEPQMHSVRAKDGNPSPAAVFICHDSKNTVILVHGAGGDHVCMYPVAEMYLENNWNVIAIDQRACGDSADDKVSFGYFERLDVAAWVSYAKEEMASEKVVIHGQSMGAATAALYVADEQIESKADAIILDSCFDSMESMFLGVWREMEGTEGIPEEYVIDCGNFYLKQHFGFGFEDADVLNKMKDNYIKTLMIQCTEDEIVPNRTAERMFENIAAKEKKICRFDSRHVEAAVNYPAEYEKAVFSFLYEE